MIFGKSTDERISTLEDWMISHIRNSHDDMVRCEDCSAYIPRINKVTVYTYVGSSEYHYCGRCKKPYTEKRVSLNDIPVKYYGEVEMTKDGKPIKK